MSQPKSPDRPPGARDEVDRRITRALRAGPAVPVARPNDPDDDVILRVLEGRGTPAEVARVAASALARERLEILQETLGAPGSAAAPLAAAARYVFAVAQDVLQFLRGATLPLAAPAPAFALRSGAAATAEPFCEFHHHFSGLDAHVRVEQVNRPSARPTLDLSVRLTEAGAPPDRGRVVIRREGKTLDSIPTDTSGAALFTELSLDTYEVELRATGTVVGVMVLEFLPA